MPEAARSTDPVVHGGTIVTGSHNVITEGQASARLFDLVKCEIHGVAAIAETSKTVIVNGRGWARKDDGCACAGASGAGPGQGDVVAFILSAHEEGKTLDEIVEETNGHGPHLQGLLGDVDGDGTLDSFMLDGSLMGFEIEGEHGRFAMDVAKVELDATYTRSENAIDGPIPLNQYGRVDVRGSALEAQGTLRLSDNVEVDGTGRLFTAHATAEGGAGNFTNADGHNVTGVVAEAGAGYAAASASGTGRVQGTAGEFLAALAPTPLGALAVGALTVGSMSEGGRELLATPVKIEATKGVSGGSAAVGGRFAAYYNHDLESAHFDLGGEIAALLGLKVDLKLTVGGNGGEEAQTGDAGPNLIVSGAGTVIVGD